MSLTSITQKFLDLFKDKDLPTEKVNEIQFRKITQKPKHEITGIECEIIGASDSTFLVSAAARICVGGQPDEDYEKRCKYIAGIIKRGHESVLEHSNVILLMYIPKKDLDTLEYSEFLAACKYLNLRVAPVEGDIIYLLIGGSIRGYKHVIRNTSRVMDNRFTKSIINAMYSSAEACFFSDFIEAGIMDKNKFTYLDTMKLTPVTFKSNAKDDDDAISVGKPEHKLIVDGRVSLFATEHASLEDVYRKVKHLFTKYDILDMVAVSVIFSDISRPIANQIVRHRNGISQESQRYVNYSEKSFIDPMFFVNKQGHTYIIDGIEYTSKQLGDKLCKIYGQLVEQGMLKQEARSFLPSNVATKLMMTFTLRNLYKFLDLRLDKAAQPEVQFVANDLLDAVHGYGITRRIIEESIKPLYEHERDKELELNESVDEVLDEYEEEQK